MFDPYGMYGYDPRFAPNPGPQRPIPRPGYTDQPQGQNGQQAGPGWVFVPRVDDIVKERYLFQVRETANQISRELGFSS